MPVYTYQCEDCGVRFDARQKFSDDALEECPECGGPVHRVPQPVGIVFKGSGFYKTDYRSESYKKAASAEKAKPSGDGAPKADSPAKSKEKAKK